MTGAPAHIGLIGGIGVAATILYYQRLTQAVAGGASLRLTIAHADAPTLVRHNLADERVAQAEIFADLIDGLARAGCDYAALTSLGAHFCWEELAARSALPLVSGVTPLDDAFAAFGARTVGLLGTGAVMRTRLYGQLVRTKAIALDEEIDHLGQTYTDMAVAGTCTEDQRRTLVNAGRRLMDAGADAVVLAGTDLNLAFDPVDPGYPLIDPVQVHVERLARIATGQETA